MRAPYVYGPALLAATCMFQCRQGPNGANHQTPVPESGTGVAGWASLECSDGQMPRFADGTWQCHTVAWADLNGVPDGFADDVDDNLLGQLSCSEGQMPVWQATNAWACGDEQESLGNLLCDSGDTVVWTGTDWACTPQLQEDQIDEMVADNGYALGSALASLESEHSARLDVLESNEQATASDLGGQQQQLDAHETQIEDHQGRLDAHEQQLDGLALAQEIPFVDGAAFGAIPDDNIDDTLALQDGLNAQT